MSSLGKKHFYIKTFGCQMNEADTDRMSALLVERGMCSADRVEDAQVVIINGCSVREKAVHKALSHLGTLQVLKRKGGPILGMGGCVGQLDQKELFRKAPYLDFVFGPDAIDQLPEILHRVEHGERHLLYTDFDASQKYSVETKVFLPQAQAYVNIMKGCDKYCSYCIVPYTRGREKSRTIEEVVGEVARYVSLGVREVTLLGQNVNSFGKGNPNLSQRAPRDLHNCIGKVGPREGDENFPQLLYALDQDPRCQDLKRIRFTSSHPLDFSEELIDCYSSVSKLAFHLHLPVQSGSDKVLQKMGRHHRIDHYFLQMHRLKSLCPGIGLSTDIIVGFPEETEEDFEKTLNLLRDLRFDQVYAFAYSPRPGTRAFQKEDDVPLEVKKKRLALLLKLQEDISSENNARMIGKTVEVLVEGEAKRQHMLQGETSERVWVGKTSCNRTVHFVSGNPWTGCWAQVRLVGASAFSLQGEVLL